MKEPECSRRSALRHWLCGMQMFLVWGCMATSAARAEPAQRNAETPAAHRERAEERVAIVVLIGVMGRGGLDALIAELLEAQSVRVRFRREDRFRSEQLLAEAADDRAIWIYVELAGDRTARLYFRGADRKRFLLRELELGRGLDALGRERLAQVIESSTLALLRSSSAGLTRAEARAAIERQIPASATHQTEKPLTTAAKAPATEDRSRLPVEVAPAASLEAWLAARYSVVWSGPELGLAHGPGAELGLASRGRLHLRGRLGVDRAFEQTLSAPEVAASIRTARLRAMADVGARVSGFEHFASLGVGGGADSVQVIPRSDDPSVTPAPEASDLNPMLTAEIRYELRMAAWALGLMVLADFSLADTHYDLRRPDGSDRIATPWIVRPGFGLAFGWSPGL